MAKTDLQDEREFNPIEYKNDSECKKILAKYNNFFIMETKEDYGIDVKLYIKLNCGRLAKIGFLELEKNRWEIKDNKFPFPTIYHKKSKVDKYVNMEKGEKGNWLPSFYLHFTRDLKHIIISKFSEIPTNNIVYNYVPYRMVGYEEDIGNTIICKVEDWEKVIFGMIQNKDVSQWDIRK